MNRTRWLPRWLTGPGWWPRWRQWCVAWLASSLREPATAAFLASWPSGSHKQGPQRQSGCVHRSPASPTPTPRRDGNESVVSQSVENDGDKDCDQVRITLSINGAMPFRYFVPTAQACSAMLRGAISSIRNRD
jgi:hypothetical protein